MIAGGVIYKYIKAIKLARAATLSLAGAEALAALPLTAIVAGIAAVLLAAEDLWLFFTDEKAITATGLWIDFLKNKLADFIVDLISLGDIIINSIKNAFSRVTDFIDSVLDPIIEKLQSIQDLFGISTNGKIDINTLQKYDPYGTGMASAAPSSMPNVQIYDATTTYPYNNKY